MNPSNSWFRVEFHDRILRVSRVNPGRAIVGRNSIAKRGTLRGLSSRARVRLIRFLATINRPDSALFVTLTYRDYSEDWKVWKKQLNAVLSALRFKWPHFCGVWRLEFQERGAPHFHLLLWPGAVTREEAEFWFRERWLTLIGGKTKAQLAHGVKVESVRDLRNSGFYLSIYQAKDKQDRTDINTGREWGYINPKALNTEPIREAVINKTELRYLRRLLRRSYQSTHRTTYHKSRYWQSLGRDGQNLSSMLSFAESWRILPHVLRAVRAKSEAFPAQLRGENSGTTPGRNGMPVAALNVTPAISTCSIASKVGSTIKS